MKLDLIKQRNEIELTLNQDTLYLLILECKYTKMMQDGFLPFALKDSGLTIKDLDRVTEVYKNRLKDLLNYDLEIIKKVSTYLKDFCKNKKNNYTTIAIKEIQAILNKYISGQIKKDLNFNKQ